VHVNPDDPVDGRRLHPGDPEHGDVVSWLHDEAALLDGHHFDAWLDLLADDLVYRAPVRVTRSHSQGIRATMHCMTTVRRRLVGARR